jgi:plastocyanin
MTVRRLTFLTALTLSATLSLAQVSGTVKLDGPAPEARPVDMAANPDCMKAHPNPVMDDTVVVDDKGNLQNVIVSILPADGQDLGGQASKDPVILNQKGCMYDPHVVALMAGQTLLIKNSDDFLHNVHSLSDNDPFNQAQMKDPDGIAITDLKTPEFFMVKCDIHPWMKAWIGVFDHPFFAITKPDGTYSFETKGLKDGSYTLQAWHEKFGTTTQKITVKDGKATANFKFSQEEKKADAGSSAKPMACCNITRASLASAAVKH